MELGDGLRQQRAKRRGVFDGFTLRGPRPPVRRSRRGAH
jgi:hypothetical protein